MPTIIRHIDQIARAKGRDVLYVVFHKELTQPVDWEPLPIRKQIIAWLDDNGIAWQACGHVANPCFYCSYRGQIYIDVPFDESDPTYRKLRDYLERPDGTMRYEDARFCYLPLAAAMQNAHHDAPGFWEKWAEDW
ncbi:MAG TPA: hypothetical protein VFF81_12255 [Noviherbaspirillum sp.]|nr:hypothetical protein [Noviherbaspirillum sp.]